MMVNFSKWYYSTVVPGLASENRIIYTVLDDGKIVAVLILKDSDEKKICTLRVAEHYRCQGIATKLLKIAHQALQCTNPLITVSSIHINEFEFLLKKNGFTLYKKYENVGKADRKKCFPAYCLKSKTIAACRKMWYNSKEVIP